MDLNEMMRRGRVHSQPDRGLAGRRVRAAREIAATATGRRLATVLGGDNDEIPKLRGHLFPTGDRALFRVDRAMCRGREEVYDARPLDPQDRRPPTRLRFAGLSPSRVSRMTSDLDEVAALSRGASGAAFRTCGSTPRTSECRDEGHVRSGGVVTAIWRCGDDGSRRFVGFDVVDTESAASWKRSCAACASAG